MDSGPPTSLIVSLSAKDRAALEALQRSTTVSVGKAKRAKIVLCIADKFNVVHTANKVGISKRLVYRWVRRFLEHGIAGLADKPRSGRPPIFSLRGSGPLGENSLRTA